MDRLTKTEELDLQAQINQQKICDIAKISEAEYKELVLIAGREFLESLFPSGTEFESARALHESDKLFWNWFRMQWIMTETFFLKHTEGSPASLDFSLSWLTTMRLNLVKSNRIFAAFANYLKSRSTVKSQKS